MNEAYPKLNKTNIRADKEGILSGVDKVIDYLESNAIPVSGEMIDQIATIATNNDAELGKLIGEAFREVGETGVVMMEPSSLGETAVEILEGVEYEDRKSVV